MQTATDGILKTEPTAIIDETDAHLTAEWIRAARATQEAIEAAESEEVRFLYEAHRRAVAQLREKTAPFDAAIQRVRGILLQWCGMSGNQAPTGVTVTQKYDIEVTDLHLVPPEFCSPDLSLIKKFVNDSKGGVAVPGVKFIAKDVLTVRDPKAKENL